jgi:hypothetical protein
MGADERIRTPDPRFTKLVVHLPQGLSEAVSKLQGTEGFRTLRLGGTGSFWLSGQFSGQYSLSDAVPKRRLASVGGRSG